MKPEKSTEAPRNAGIDPSTMKMKQWYQGQDRVTDQKAPTGTNSASYHAREPIKDDAERLAMRQGDMAPPVPERVTNPRIRDDRAVQDFQLNSENMHRATYEDAYTRAWFDYCRSVFPQSVRKTGTNVDLCNVSTYQSSILFDNMGSFNQVHFGKLRTWTSRLHHMRSSTSPMTLSCHFSEKTCETTTRM